jgi:hypothetical protein
MALLYVTGFDNFGDIGEMKRDGWRTTNDSEFSTVTSPVRFGGRSFRIEGYGTSRKAYLHLRQPSNDNTIIIGFGWRTSWDATNNWLFWSLWRLGVPIVSLRWDADRTLEMIENQGGTVLCSGDTVLELNTWYFFEMKIVIHPTNGSVEMYINEDLEMSATGVDTQNSGASDNLFDTVRFDSTTDGSSSYGCIDDLYICDGSGAQCNDLLGEIRVDTLMPEGPGNYTQFTPSGEVNNWEAVDDVTADDANLVESNTPGNIDTYIYPNLPDIGEAAIHAVAIGARVQRNDATVKRACLFTRIENSDYSGEHLLIYNEYQFEREIFEVNPDDSQPWDVEAVNSGEFGVKLVG